MRFFLFLIIIPFLSIAQNKYKKNNHVEIETSIVNNHYLINYSFYTALSLCVVHIIGIIYLIFGKLFWSWSDNLSDLILINTIIPFSTQLLLCISVSLLSILLKRILIVK